MKRNEMLELLSEHPTAAELVVLTSEMAIECTYISRQGFKNEWLGIDQWPAYAILFADKNSFLEISERISAHLLKLEDIQDTALCSVYTDLFEKTGDLNVIFSQLTDIEYPENGKIYLLRTSEGVKIFAEYDDFDAYFVKELLTDCTPWETLNDDELEEWIERVRSEFKGIPCLEYEE